MKNKEIEQIYRLHYAKMMRMARAMLYEEEEACDVVSEVFATLAERPLPIESVEGYLRTSVRNRCLNLIAKKSVRAKFEQAYTLETPEEAVDAEDTEQCLQLLMAFAQRTLTEQTLRVFRMRHIDGMKYQEIADALGISRVMVYKHLAQAMEKVAGFVRFAK